MMHKQFDELKKQLSELSETLNRFESEAVQLRIVELLFKQQDGDGLAEEANGYRAGPGFHGVNWVGGRSDVLAPGSPPPRAQDRAECERCRGRSE